MMEVVLCHAKPGNLATKRVPTSPGKVSQLLDKATSLTSVPGERLVLTYQGHILKPSADLEVPKGGLVMITVLPPPPPPPAAPTPVKMTGDEIKRSSLYFRGVFYFSDLFLQVHHCIWFCLETPCVQQGGQATGAKRQHGQLGCCLSWTQH